MNSQNKYYQLPTIPLQQDPAAAVAHYKLLLLSLSGIGNYLMHTPFIEQIKKQRPHWRTTLWCAARGQAELARVNPNINDVIEHSLQAPFYKDIPFLLQLRRHHYDAAVMLSPGQRLKGAAYLTTAGISRRIAHQYPFLHRPAVSLLLTDAVPEQPRIHDIEQNLALLPLLGLNYSLSHRSGTPPRRWQTTHYKLSIPTENRQKASDFLLTLGVPADRPLIALHPGSAPNAAFKRWPLPRFAALATRLIENHQTHILILGSNAEEELKQNLLSQLTAYHLSLTTITADLLTTAAILQRCRLFIGNDSGLMHLSAGVGTPTLGLFGPTDEHQVGPRGPHSQALRAAGTQPVYDTEKNWQLGDKPHPTLERLNISQVISTATDMLQSAI